MRYTRALLFSLLVALTGSSFAGTVDMTLENVGPGNQIGGEYTYPYYFSINGSNSLTPLICDTYSNSISFCESWQATVSTLPPSGTGIWSGLPNATQYYEASAILFSELLNHTEVAGQAVNSTTGNLAIWALFDGGRSNGGWTPYEQTLIDQALHLAAYGQSASFYSQFQVYSPVGASPGNGPQEFIGCSNGTCSGVALSEPASLPILGSGLMIFLGLLHWTTRRRETEAEQPVIG
jgi:hypothetical protein